MVAPSQACLPGTACCASMKKKREEVCSASVSLAFLNYGARDENRRQDAGATNRARMARPRQALVPGPPRRTPTKKRLGLGERWSQQLLEYSVERDGVRG